MISNNSGYANAHGIDRGSATMLDALVIVVGLCRIPMNRLFADKFTRSMPRDFQMTSTNGDTGNAQKRRHNVNEMR